MSPIDALANRNIIIHLFGAVSLQLPDALIVRTVGVLSECWSDCR